MAPFVLSPLQGPALPVRNNFFHNLYSMLGDRIAEIWHAGYGVALSGGRVVSWTGQRRGITMVAPSASQYPYYQADGSFFKGKNVVYFTQANSVALTMTANAANIGGSSTDLPHMLLVLRNRHGTIPANGAGYAMTIVHWPRYDASNNYLGRMAMITHMQSQADNADYGARAIRGDFTSPQGQGFTGVWLHVDNYGAKVGNGLAAMTQQHWVSWGCKLVPGDANYYYGNSYSDLGQYDVNNAPKPVMNQFNRFTLCAYQPSDVAFAMIIYLYNKMEDGEMNAVDRLIRNEWFT